MPKIAIFEGRYSFSKLFGYLFIKFACVFVLLLNQTIPTDPSPNNAPLWASEPQPWVMKMLSWENTSRFQRNTSWTEFSCQKKFVKFFISLTRNVIIGVSKNSGTPKWMVYNGKTLLKWMIWGENPLFSETSIWWFEVQRLILWSWFFLLSSRPAFNLALMERCLARSTWQNPIQPRKAKGHHEQQPPNKTKLPNNNHHECPISLA